MSGARRLTLMTFGFKYGHPPTNFFFDVSFIRNPAREGQWSLFSRPCPEMREFVLGQTECQAFLATAIPFIRTLVNLDDDVRIGLGCSSGRHRSYIIADQIRRELEAEDIQVKVIHREEQYL